MVNNDFINPIAEFVLAEGIERYEELNAPTILDADIVFREKLAELMKKQKVVSKMLGRGGQFSVHELVENRNLVIKRLLSKVTGKSFQGTLNEEEYFELMLEQHKLIEKYFGNDYVPYTEFIIVNSNFGHFDPERFIEGKEYVMVQERLYGIEINKLPEGLLTSKIRELLYVFIKKYNRMMVEEKKVIENQLFVDFVNKRVTIFDTNHPKSFEMYKSGNRFLEYFNIPETSISNSQDILNIFAIYIPELSFISNVEYQTEVANKLFVGEESTFFIEIMKILKARFKECKEDVFLRGKKVGEYNYVAHGFRDLLAAVDYFPPEGNNIFIRRLIEKFDL